MPPRPVARRIAVLLSVMWLAACSDRIAAPPATWPAANPTCVCVAELKRSGAVQGVLAQASGLVTTTSHSV